MIKYLKIPTIFIVLIVISVYLLNGLDEITFITRDSILYACLIAAINFLIFIWMTDYSFKKSNKIFLIFSLGGIGIRVFLMLILVFLVIKFLKIDEFKFIFTFFLLYVLFLIYEINIIRLKAEKPLKASKNTENVVQ